MAVYQKFYEMEMWKEAFNLQKEVFELTSTFPKDERYGLISQINNSSNSVVANIAESHGRYHFSDKIRVLYIVRGELSETQSHLIVAASRKYITETACTNLVSEYETLKIKINNAISKYMSMKQEE